MRKTSRVSFIKKKYKKNLLSNKLQKKGEKKTLNEIKKSAHSATFDEEKKIKKKPLIGFSSFVYKIISLIGDGISFFFAIIQTKKCQRNKIERKKLKSLEKNTRKYSFQCQVGIERRKKHKHTTNQKLLIASTRQT